MVNHPTGEFITDPLQKLHYMRQLRELAGWTQCQMATHLGVQQSQVSAWENRRTKPDFVSGYHLMVLLDNLQMQLLGLT
jgi:transcriptional regulator with XRE-family HTH domain